MFQDREVVYPRNTMVYNTDTKSQVRKNPPFFSPTESESESYEWFLSKCIIEHKNPTPLY